MPIVWTVRDSKGELLPRFIAGSPREVARQIVTTRYDAFRLEVSASYREQFDRDLKTVLARHDWQIVPSSVAPERTGATRASLNSMRP